VSQNAFDDGSFVDESDLVDYTNKDPSAQMAFCGLVGLAFQLLSTNTVDASRRSDPLKALADTLGSYPLDQALHFSECLLSLKHETSRTKENVLGLGQNAQGGDCCRRHQHWNQQSVLHNIN